jgi:CBS-domain-containing membrane protein
MNVQSYLQRMRGGGVVAPRPPLRAVVRPFLGALLAIAAVAYLTSATAVPLVLGSFGASCVLLFGFPDNPFSQPRNVIGGHVLASLTGLVFLAVFGHA